ncbi:P-loop NTPase fold protein [Amphritea sp. HPY]|uniref:P-loop NTPase fold protein n=1 Tax=Amphritea sp. HPY TaxID=3421652 RepID=UPI003D7CE5C5
MDIEHLQKSFESYITSDSRFAVLINGKWGTGKTYLLTKQLFPIAEKKQKKFFRVSAFGVTDSKSLQAKIAAGVLGNKTLDIASLVPSLAGTTSKFFGGVPGVDKVASALGSVVERRLIETLGSNTVIAIDDIERTSMEIPEMLGVLNDLVEQQGCKLILLADEARLLDKNSESDNKDDLLYKEAKEKVIGYTWTFEWDTFDMAKLLAENAGERLKPVVQEHLNDVIQLIDTTKCHNLRIWIDGLTRLEGFFEKVESYCDKDSELQRNFLLEGLFTIYWHKHPELMMIPSYDRKNTLVGMRMKLGSSSERDKPENASKNELVNKIESVDAILGTTQYSSLIYFVEQGYWDQEKFEEEYKNHRSDLSETPWKRNLYNYEELSNDGFDHFINATTRALEEGDIQDLSDLCSLVSTMAEMKKRGLINTNLKSDWKRYLEKVQLINLNEELRIRGDLPESLNRLERYSSRDSTEEAEFFSSTIKLLKELYFASDSANRIEKGRLLWKAVGESRTPRELSSVFINYGQRGMNTIYITEETAENVLSVMLSMDNALRRSFIKMFYSVFSEEVSDMEFRGLKVLFDLIKSYIETNKPEKIELFWYEEYKKEINSLINLQNRYRLPVSDI